MRRMAQAGGSVKELIRRHKPDYQLVMYMGVLVLLGVVVLFAISPARVELMNAAGENLDRAHFMQRQLTYLFIGLMAFAAAATIPLSIWQKNAAKVLVGALAACLLLGLLGIFEAPPALCALGACRWYNLGFATFQPAELLKFGVLLFLAGFLGRRMLQGKINDLHETIVPVSIVAGLAAFFVVIAQRDMGTGIVLMSIIATMLFVSGLNKRFGLMMVGAVVGLGFLMIIMAPHRMERIATFFNPSSDAGGSSYHINQAKIAIGTGGFFGVGLGNSVSAFGYVPEAVNDSIFAIMGELFGFVGLLAVIALFVALLLRILGIMDTVHDPPMKLLVAGVFGWIATHVVVNIGAMIGIFPLTGITLPFLSFGGTSLLFIMMALGLVLQVSRYTSHEAKIKGGVDEDTRSWRRFRGTRHTSRRRS